MIISPNEELLLAFAMPLLAVATQAVVSVHGRLRSYAKAQCISRILYMIVTEDEPTDEDIRQLRLRFSIGTILDAAIFISEHIYGNSLNRLSLVVEVCEVDYYLLHRIRRCRTKREVLLAKLSHLAHAVTIVEHTNIYLDEEQHYTNFFATAALVAARPERAIRYIARLGYALTWHEVAILTQLMRWAGVPIAYTPLLTSENRNLQLIGIYLCEHFSIVDAEAHLQQLAESEEYELAYMALLTLCTIRSDLSTPQVGNALARLQPLHRSAFIRRAVQSCYSLHSCAKHLSCKEQRVFRQLIDSYKCRIVCN